MASATHIPPSMTFSSPFNTVPMMVEPPGDPNANTGVCVDRLSMMVGDIDDIGRFPP